MVRQNHRSFVERVDFVTSVGYGIGPGDRERLGLTGAGPEKIITDLGVLEPDPETLRVHPDRRCTRACPPRPRKERTGWDLAIAADPEIIAAPTPAELDALRAFPGHASKEPPDMTTADVSASPGRGREAGRLVLPSYERPAPGVHPPLDFEGYRSTALRHPKQPLVLLPHRLTEVTGPLLGHELIIAHRLRPDHPARRRAAGAADHRDRPGARLGRPAGARHADRDLADERGRALPALARASPRPARPELRRPRAVPDRRGRPVPVHHHPAWLLSLGEPLQRLAPGAHPLLAVRPGLHPAAGHPDVLPRRPAAAA